MLYTFIPIVTYLKITCAVDYCKLLRTVTFQLYSCHFRITIFVLLYMLRTYGWLKFQIKMICVYFTEQTQPNFLSSLKLIL